MTKVNVPQRLDDSGIQQTVTVPDHVDILFQLANGAQGHMRVSNVTGLAPGSQTWLYGSEGTIYIDQQLRVWGGRRGETELKEIENPQEKQSSWQVEKEFVDSIRNGTPVLRTPFNVGVHYMEFTEAVTRSAQTGQAIALPL